MASRKISHKLDQWTYPTPGRRESNESFEGMETMRPPEDITHLFMPDDYNLTTNGDLSPRSSPQSVILVNTNSIGASDGVSEHHGVRKKSRYVADGYTRLPKPRRLSLENEQRDVSWSLHGRIKGNKEIIDTPLSRDKTIVNSPTPVSFAVDDGNSSSVSKAPFAATEPVFDARRLSLSPARIGSDLIRPTEITRMDEEPLGSIENILRGHSARKQVLKRKREETTGTVVRDFLRISPSETKATSLGSTGSRSATINAPVFQLIEKYIPAAAAVEPPKKDGLGQRDSGRQDLCISESPSSGHDEQDLDGKKQPHEDTELVEVQLNQSGREGDRSDKVRETVDDLQRRYTGDNAIDKSLAVVVDATSGSDLNVGLLTGEDGRPYNLWKLNDSETIPTRGALLPTNYQLHSTIETPWVCPLRSCRLLFATIGGLGGHFNAKHRRALLNDNGDGTVSTIGFREGEGRIPAIIVSRKPLDDDEPPMPPPRQLRQLGIDKPQEDRNALDSQTKPAVTTDISHFERQIVKDPVIEPSRSLGTKNGPKSRESTAQTRRIWDESIYPHLQKTPKEPIPTKGYVSDLLPDRPKRHVEFNPHAPEFFESRERDIAALVIQISGNEAPTPCERCRAGKGPFSGCIVISTDAPLHVRKQITSCANCYYKGNQSRCVQLPKWHRDTYPELSALDSKAEKRQPVITEPTAEPAEDTQSPARRSKRVRSTSQDTSLQGRPLEVEQGKSGQETDIGTSGIAAVHLTTETDRSDKDQPISGNRSVLQHDKISTRAKNDSLSLPMEDWEIAPGRIRHNLSNGFENIAFSNAYLAHGVEAAISPGIGFQVLVVKPGTTHRFEPSSDRIRLCAISAGKLKVSILELKFEIGPPGMFQIKLGTSCTVENRIYADAVVYVTTITK